MKSNFLSTIKKKRWLLERNAKIFRVEEAKEFVKRLGLVSALSNEHLPSLAKAIYTADLPNRFEASQRLWDFVHILITKKWVYYGRILPAHNTIVSMELLPCFLHLYPIPDYRSLYEQRILSEMGKQVMDLLHERGPLMTQEIRNQLGISSLQTRKELAHALVELQRKSLLCCAGKVAQCRCRWRFGIWAPVDKWVPRKIKTKARALSDEEAKRRIIDKYVYTAVRTTPKAIARFFNWSLKEIDSTLSSMIDKEVVSSYNHQGEEYLFKGNL
ncbi:hypothetical protein AMJ83_09505 [candidate division WOR_3 bacterium SM23_42]|uniref:Uncharacterized protein n=1 Tax=candidate division WOR_3 bacterium SM23_42 TaxID=1703779 RepID=A0A0S8FRU5_UNCW3|nr:MAG: hypothetical protein AMJ83_09505 [candidate division WOR_3 bacterium SM23_42]